MRLLIQALQEWWGDLGGLAWPLMGIVLLTGIAAMILLLRWIWNGGLSRRTAFGFGHHGHRVDESRWVN